MQRLLNAFRNSSNGLVHAAKHETAFRQEVVLFALSVPVAMFLAGNVPMFMALTGSVVLLMIVELLNTGIEAVCDGLSREFTPEIKIAKDCGSAAVLLTSLLAGVIWLWAIAERVGDYW